MTVCNNVHKCLDLFYRNFNTENINLPTRREAEKEAQLMSRISGKGHLCYTGPSVGIMMYGFRFLILSQP